MIGRSWASWLRGGSIRRALSSRSSFKSKCEQRQCSLLACSGRHEGLSPYTERSLHYIHPSSTVSFASHSARFGMLLACQVGSSSIQNCFQAKVSLQVATEKWKLLPATSTEALPRCDHDWDIMNIMDVGRSEFALKQIWQDSVCETVLQGGGRVPGNPPLVM